MPLPLPGESRSSPRLLEVLIAVAIVVGLCGLCGLGCATAPARSAARTRRLPARVFAGAHVEIARAARPADEGAAFVARALHDGGLHFGTDGSTRALWEYLRLAHGTVAPAAVRAGDVLFFDTHAGDAEPDCDDVTDHAGIVEGVEPDGRILFVEARGGELRRSVVDPSHPALRRNARGDIANSFLRAKQVSDPPDARYFAGQMLCGVARVAR